MAMVTAITSLTFQKDAKTMPLAYIVGFIMHFMSMVKLSWAIGAFMLNVFPGRKEIEPSYCSLWTSYLEGATCSIDVGVGLVFTASALATVAVSFIGEVIVQGSHKYGVNTAFRVLVGRVRDGRVQDLSKSWFALVDGRLVQCVIVTYFCPHTTFRATVYSQSHQ